MFKINKKKRLIVSVFVAVAVILPATIFAVSNFAKTNNSFASASSDATAQAAGFADADFYDCVIKAYNLEKGTSLGYDTVLTNAQMASIKSVDCGKGSSEETKVSNATGVEKLTGLETLSLNGNTFSSIDLSHNTSLVNLYAYLTPNLTSLDLSHNTALKFAQVGKSGLTSITTGNIGIETLDANFASIRSLDLSGNTSIQYVYLRDNNVSSLKMANPCAAKAIDVRGNSSLSSITNLTQCSNMISLAIMDDNFSSINLNNFPNLIAFKATGNPLTQVSIANNKKLNNLQLESNVIVKTGVTPTESSGNYVYDFSNFAFLERSEVSLASSSNYSLSGERLTVTNYPATGGYANVVQNPNPASDASSNNDQKEDLYNNHYRLELAEPEQQNVYMIEYDYNGGTLNGTTGPTTEYCRFTGSLGETCTTTISSIRPTRSGYTFLGWSASRTATTASYTAGNSFSTNTDKTFYAVWRQNSPTPTTKTLTYDANGGTNAPNAESCSSTEACDVTITSNQPTRDGYTFLGWATISTATTPNTNYSAGKVVPISTNTTLYAVWQPNSGENTYVMAFDANKGTGAPSNVTCKGQTSCSATIPDVKPTRDGYTFKGWGTSADATEAKYQPGESVTIAANTTLYAVWEANASGVVTPDTGAPTEGSANGLAIIVTAMPIIALGVFVGIKLNRNRKSHIKFD